MYFWLNMLNVQIRSTWYPIFSKNPNNFFLENIFSLPRDNCIIPNETFYMEICDTCRGRNRQISCDQIFLVTHKTPSLPSQKLFWKCTIQAALRSKQFNCLLSTHGEVCRMLERSLLREYYIWTPAILQVKQRRIQQDLNTDH